MNNRIVSAIDRMKTQIKDRLTAGITTKAKLKATAKTLDMDIEEHAMFQEKKSLAVATGKLTGEEGQTLYSLLGNTPSVFNKRPIEVKYVLTGLFKELLGGLSHED